LQPGLSFFFQSGSEGADSFGSAEVPLVEIIGSPETLFAGLCLLELDSPDWDVCLLILSFFISP
jgi:hypothetical protein